MQKEDPSQVPVSTVYIPQRKADGKDGAEPPKKPDGKEKPDAKKNATAPENQDGKQTGGQRKEVTDRLNFLKGKVTEMAENNMNALRERMRFADSDEEDEPSSDEEQEEDWSSQTPNTIPSESATVVRSQLPNCISIEREQAIKSQLKDAKTLRNHLRKLKKLYKRSTKVTQQATANIDAVLEGFETTCAGTLIDSSIQNLVKEARTKMHEVLNGPTCVGYAEKTYNPLVQTIKPLSDHAKLVSKSGKERRVARGKLLTIERRGVDVGSEAVYAEATEALELFKEKDEVYTEEFQCLYEHTSAQFGQSIQTFFLETANLFEELASAFRVSVTFDKSNWFLSDNCWDKYKDYKVDPKLLAPAAPLFSSAVSNTVLDGRLTTKPDAQTTAPAVVTGIPMTSSEADREAPAPFSSSQYTQPLDESAAPPALASQDDVDYFLRTGQIRESVVPQPTMCRDEKISTPRGSVHVYDPKQRSRDYIQQLKTDYGLNRWSSKNSSSFSRARRSTNTDKNNISYGPNQSASLNGSSGLPPI